MKSLLHAFATLALAATLTGCTDDRNDKGAQPAGQQVTYQPGSHVDAEDYTGPRQAVTGKHIEPEVLGTGKKTETKCVKRVSGKCKKTKKVTTDEEYVKDDMDHVLDLADGTTVDVDEAVFDSYDLTDAQVDVFPR